MQELSKAGRLTRMAIKLAAPDLLKGILQKFIDGKDLGTIHNFLLNMDLWGSIGSNQQDFLLNYRPWDLSWLTLEWVINAVGEKNKAAAMMIFSSPAIQTNINNEIESIKTRLA